MADKMLIDASHEEETRVVVVRGNRIEEFDFESQHKKQIRGNIYLAKVTRVEPSLQAAFVDYGGNRHGFLAFAEIHPDYYQIPLADRQALLKAEAEEHRRDDDVEHVETALDLSQQEQPDIGIVHKDEAEADIAQEAPALEVAAPAEEEAPVKKAKPRRSRKKVVAEAPADEAPAVEATATVDAPSEDEEGPSGEMAAMVETDSISEDVDVSKRRHDDDDDDDHDQEEEVIESVGAEDAMEEVPDRVQRKPRKQYRIQEVIKRRQILLVQVAKEERGNKGAALTTYLSLAGRYSVLMPNTARGGGISRKITNPQDRKRLKEIAKMLEVPQGMGVILRTAGANRTKVEVKRDFEYLMRLWENVRTLTLASTAPCLVYEEGSLIKRSIRDLYNKDISEIIVAGEEGYREAKDFMKMLMPSSVNGFDPEKVDSYEGGLKGYFFDRRLSLNTAVFYAKYKDQQITQQTPVGASIASQVLNVGKSHIYGAEVEGQATFTSSLFANFSLGYTKAEFDEYRALDLTSTPPVVRDFADSRVFQNTPKWNGSASLTWRHDLGDHGSIAVIPSASYRSSFHMFEIPSILDQDSYWLLDASVVWTSADDRYTVGLHGKNLGKEEYRIGGYNFPQSAGVLFGNSVTAYYGPPRTVTLSVQAKF